MVKECIRQKKIQFEKKKPTRKKKGEKNFLYWKISQTEKRKVKKIFSKKNRKKKINKKNLKKKIWWEGQREKTG
jgi:hypothetical protein